MLKRLFSPILKAPEPKPDPVIELLVAGAMRRVSFRRSARAKRYTLRLKPGAAEFVVTMPVRGTLTFAKDFALRHVGWMEKRLKRTAEHTPFLPGMVVPVLNVPHRIEHRPAQQSPVAFGTTEDGNAALLVGGDPAHAPRRIADFLKAEALKRLTQASRKHAAALGVTISRITVRDTVSRWGSCSSSGALSYSWRIIMAPEFVLDYLAAHEVAHRKEMNHSPRYWRVVASLDPDFERAEAWLKRNGASLHRYGPARL